MRSAARSPKVRSLPDRTPGCLCQRLCQAAAGIFRSSRTLGAPTWMDGGWNSGTAAFPRAVPAPGGRRRSTFAWRCSARPTSSSPMEAHSGMARLVPGRRPRASSSSGWLPSWRAAAGPAASRSSTTSSESSASQPASGAPTTTAAGGTEHESPDCDDADLRIRQFSGGSEASQPYAIVAVVNSGPTCQIDGYPGVESVQSHEVTPTPRPTQSLAVAVHDGSDYERLDPAPRSVTLSTGGSVSFALGTDTAPPGPVYGIGALSIALPPSAAALAASNVGIAGSGNPERSASPPSFPACKARPSDEHVDRHRRPGP